MVCNLFFRVPAYLADCRVIALGFLVGVLLAAWSTHVVEKGETLILLAGCVLLCVGVSHVLQLSPLIATLTVGATMVNLSAESRRLFEALGQTDPPLYAIFFVIAGADLNIGLLATLGVLGVIYVVAKIVSKAGGTVARIARLRYYTERAESLGFRNAVAGGTRHRLDNHDRSEIPRPSAGGQYHRPFSGSDLRAYRTAQRPSGSGEKRGGP